jgi:citrate lyase beta subunit
MRSLAAKVTVVALVQLALVGVAVAPRLSARLTGDEYLLRVAPVDPVIDDPDRFRSTSEALGRMGFVGRACIHPSQVAIATEVFTPSRDEIRWATELLKAQAANPHGAGRDRDGRMVDEAVLRRARTVAEWTDDPSVRE